MNGSTHREPSSNDAAELLTPISYEDLRTNPNSESHQVHQHQDTGRTSASVGDSETKILHDRNEDGLTQPAKESKASQCSKASSLREEPAHNANIDLQQLSLNGSGVAKKKQLPVKDDSQSDREVGSSIQRCKIVSLAVPPDNEDVITVSLLDIILFDRFH